MTPERWQRIEQLYHAALERAPDQRATFLVEACAADETLQREVAVLLAANERAGSFMDTPALGLEARELAAEQTLAVESRVSAGQQFSHYQVLSRLGAGGMGEVWLARDTRLERKVALKVLPAQFTQDAERLRRFSLEAKAASALNHPNIITIYEIGEAAWENGDTHFIATEYIEGVTLRERLATGKFRLSAALEVALQIAAALDTAHRAGIVHRDIKPENIMVRPDGLVKVLDFGLAKLTEPQMPAARASEQISVSTAQGMLLGTPRYMSPEQARGQKVDARTDIFSFGEVLYEMITGQPPFIGESMADLFAAILHQEPLPLAQHTPDAPAELERIISQALAKDYKDRYQTIRDLQLELQALSYHSADRQETLHDRNPQTAGEQGIAQMITRSEALPTGQSVAVTTNPTHSLSGRLLASLTRPAPVPPATIVAGLIIIGVALWFFWPRTRPVTIPRELQFNQLFARKGQDSILLPFGRFSPNGKMIAFGAPGDGENIWVRQIASDHDTQTTFGKWKDSSPVWSPDSEQIAFVSDRGHQVGLWVMAAINGTPALLKTLGNDGTPATGGRHRLIAWAKNESAIYYEWNEQLFRLELNSKEITPINHFNQPFQARQDFSLSPDEKEIAFIGRRDGQTDVWRVGLQSGTPQRVTNNAAFEQRPIWLADGRLLYNSTSNGRLQIFMAEARGGEAVLIPTGDHQCQLNDYSAASNRLLCYEQRDESDIFAVQINTGNEQQVTNDLGVEFWSSVSPDGATLLYQAIQGERFVWEPRKSLLFTKPVTAREQSANQPPTRLTADAFEAQWSPDGRQIGFLRLAGASPHLWRVNAAGGEEKQLVTSNVLYTSHRNSPPYNRTQPKAWCWSPDSRRIVYSALKDGVDNVWIVNADGTGTTQITSNTDATLRFVCPLWSPDGQRLAYLIEAGEPSQAGKERLNVQRLNEEKPATIYQTDAMVRLLGWSANDGLMIALTDNLTAQTTTVKLLSLALSKENKLIETMIRQSQPDTLTETYFINVHLSPNGRDVAFVKAQNGRNDIWVTSVTNGQMSPARKITTNSDPSFFLSSLTWSPDGKIIYYDKQTRWSLLTMIDRFN